LRIGDKDSRYHNKPSFWIRDYLLGLQLLLPYPIISAAAAATYPLIDELPGHPHHLHGQDLD
jgi:hypothetical protein